MEKDLGPERSELSAVGRFPAAVVLRRLTIFRAPPIIRCMSDGETKKLKAQLAALRDITRAITAAASLDKILSLITTKTARVMDMDSCSIYLADEKREHLVLKATTGLAPPAVGHARLLWGEGLTGYA